MLELFIAFVCLFGLLAVPISAKKIQNRFFNDRTSSSDAVSHASVSEEPNMAVNLKHKPVNESSQVVDVLQEAEWLFNKAEPNFFGQSFVVSHFSGLEIKPPSYSPAMEPDVVETENVSRPKIVSIAEYQNKKKVA